MYLFVCEHKALSFIIFVITVLIVVFILKFFIKKFGMERVRGVAYKAFLIAEHHFNKGENSKKFEYVIAIVYAALPEFFRFFISEQFLRETVQEWFILIKDLLDDGKINKEGE